MHTTEWGGEHPALGALRAQLVDGLARAGLDKTQLAVRAGLGRTTVHQAFQVGGPAPSAKTVAALGRALRLPTDELLALLRATANLPAETKPVLGRPIAEWNPHDLEVHPAGFAPRVHDSTDAQKLPGYVARDHDRLLAATVRDVLLGGSRMVVLVGSSSTGKTRACWEAVQPLAAEGWMLWHPFDPSRAAAALEELHLVGPQTVVWLNESQHYLGDQRSGEQIAAALHGLLVDPSRGPVLVLGTLWPEYASQYAARPEPGNPDPHSRVRELLTGRTLTVPEAFDVAALEAASVLADAGDRLLAESLARTDSGRLAQDLAGAPALLDRYEHGTPAAKALLEAAMDTRRLGHGPSLSYGLLAEGAEGYLTDEEWSLLPEDWLEAGMAYVAAPVTGMHGPLVRRRPRTRRTPGAAATSDLPHYRLADYLDQHGRRNRQDEPVPATLWEALLTHGDRSGFLALGESAEARGLLRLAAQFYAEVDGGAEKLASLLDSCGRQEEARLWWIHHASESGDGYAVGRVVATAPSNTPEAAESILNWWWEDVPKNSAQRADLSTLIRSLGPTDDPKTMMWWRRAAEQGHTSAEKILVDHLRETGGDDAVLTWYLERCRDNRWYRSKAADLLVRLNRPKKAMSLLSTSDEDDSDAHLQLGRLLLSSGQDEKAVEWLAKAGRNLKGFSGAQAVRELFRVGQGDVALGVLESATEADDEAFVHAARLLDEAGRHGDSADFWRRAAAVHDPDAWVCLQYARSLARYGELPEALAWYRRAVEGGERRFLQTIEPWEAELLASQGKTEADLTQWRLTYAATTHFLGKPLRRWNAPLDEKLTWLFELTERGHPSAMGYAIRRLCDAGRESEALEWARSLAERGYDQAPRRVAELYAQAGELGLALRWWQRSAQDTRYTSGAYRAAGEALRDAGKMEEAVKWFRRATEAGDIDLLGLTVEGYETLDRHGEALVWLWELAVRGWHPCVRLAADVLERAGREQEAEQLRRYGWEPDGSTAAAWPTPLPTWPGRVPAIVGPQSVARAR